MSMGGRRAFTEQTNLWEGRAGKARHIFKNIYSWVVCNVNSGIFVFLFIIN
uniref:Uncharacterized protein n=1 Tax=Anguilla anguilla TaxID=7936 RepID=A0A0E9XJ14_ANGAN